MSAAPHEKKPSKALAIQASYQVLLVLSILSALFYIVFILDFNIVRSWPLYIALLGIEGYVILQTVTVWWTALYSGNDPRDHHYHAAKKELLIAKKIEGGVDVFITVYGEDINTITATAHAVRDMHIEHNTYILDDGKSDAVRSMAQKLKIGYIRSTNNKNAKAGNVNNGLAHTSGKYIVVFDADFVPKPHFLQETLPFFNEEEVAFVQTPQVLGNRTNMFSIGSSDSQKVFYGLIGAGKNRFNSMFWVGTNAVFRRAALEDVGGVYTHTSEDILTAYRLHQREWKSVYIPDALAIGEGPDNLVAYMKQQLRWAGGGMYMFLKENPLFKKLSFDQKWQYFSTATFYFSGFVVLGMLLFPLIFIYFNIRPIETDGIAWATRYIPYFLFQFVMILLLSGQFSWQSYVISINSFTAYINAFIQAVIGKKISWSFTTGRLKSSGIVKLSILWPHWIIFILSVLAFPLSVLAAKDVTLTLISLFWITINIITIGTFLYQSYKIK
jgi:cellulose synthase (UDP-forming)